MRAALVAVRALTPSALTHKTHAVALRASGRSEGGLQAALVDRRPLCVDVNLRHGPQSATATTHASGALDCYLRGAKPQARACLQCLLRGVQRKPHGRHAPGQLAAGFSRCCRVEHLDLVQPMGRLPSWARTRSSMPAPAHEQSAHGAAPMERADANVASLLTSAAAVGCSEGNCGLFDSGVRVANTSQRTSRSQITRSFRSSQAVAPGRS